MEKIKILIVSSNNTIINESKLFSFEQDFTENSELLIDLDKRSNHVDRLNKKWTEEESPQRVRLHIVSDALMSKTPQNIINFIKSKRST